MQGEAIGVGCALAAVCDMTLAADDAVFQVPELNHNIAPTLVMWALINRVPYKTAAYLVYSRETHHGAARGIPRRRHQGDPGGRARKRSGGAVAKPAEPRARRRCKGIKEFLKFGSRMDPASASAYSATLNAALCSAPRRRASRTGIEIRACGS